MNSNDKLRYAADAELMAAYKAGRANSGFDMLAAKDRIEAATLHPPVKGEWVMVPLYRWQVEGSDEWHEGRDWPNGARNLTVIEHAPTPPADKQDGITDTERHVIETLLNLAYSAWGLADNTEDSGGEGLTIERSDFALLEKHLNTLSDLPDDQPGYTMGEAAKARWALRSLLVAKDAAPAPSEASNELE